MIALYSELRQRHLSEYLYFARYGLIAALVLIVLPYAAPAVAPTMFTNLFVMDATGVFYVTLFACLAAMTAVYVTVLTWRSVPARHELPFTREGNWREEVTAACRTRILTRKRALLSGLLTVPSTFSILLQSSSPSVFAIGAACLGVLAAAALREAGEFLAELRSADGNTEALTRLDKWAQNIPVWRTYHRLPDEVRVYHVRAGGFFLVGLLFYAVIGYVSRPGMSGSLNAVPTLAYMLIILMLMTWALGVLAFLCDRPRIPILLPIAAVLLIVQAIGPNDHVYQVLGYNRSVPDLTTSDALRQRHGGNPDRPLVIVTASGGGIAASLWTGRVLEGLTAALPEFHERVDVLSAVSGGGVTTMFYVDRYTDGTVATTEGVRGIKDVAAKPSLSAVGWGLAYPDLWRNALPGLVKGDRGQAQEVAWDQRLLKPGTTVRSWDTAVLAGERPVPLWNATAQETGGRIVFAPLRIDEPAKCLSWTAGETRMRLEHLDDVDGNPIDLRAATAVRLAAAFPFVSPHARPDTELTNGSVHAADGGYYDNSGIITAIEVADAFLATTPPDKRPSKVIIIEIRTGEDATLILERKLPRRSGGIINSIRGPLDTLYNAREATQISRTQMELDLLATSWCARYRVELIHEVFHLSSDFPLSWQLTQQEIDAIEANWPGTGAIPTTPPALRANVLANQASLREIQKHWPQDVSVVRPPSSNAVDDLIE